MATLSLLDGITTDVFSEACALRMRVSMSAMGSLMLMHNLLLPARLGEPWNLATHGDIAQLVAREAEFAEHAARPSRDRAAIAQPHRARVPRQLLQPKPRFVAIF